MKNFTLLTFICIFLLAFPAELDAQNLVIDPGFEGMSQCPTSGGRFYHVTNTTYRYLDSWRNPTHASPDYNHSCGFNTFAPRTGDGYTGIIIYDGSGTREFVTALLSTPLIAGEDYTIEAYLALSTGSVYATDHFDFSLTATQPLDLTYPPTGSLAVPKSLPVANGITAASYTLVTGTYTAVGGEQYLTLGNLNNNASTTLITARGSGSLNSYYFVDDVSVIPNNPLPVDFISLKANESDGLRTITWDVENEMAHHYVLEKSKDGDTYVNAKIKLADGSGQYVHEYVEKDIGYMYYRVKFVEENKRAGYSNVVLLEGIPMTFEISKLYPSPSADMLQVEVISTEETNMTIDIKNIIGQEAFHGKERATVGAKMLNIPIVSLRKGAYIIVIQDSKGNRYTNKFIKR